MPTYTYEKQDGTRVEVQHSMNTTLTHIDGEPVTKIISLASVNVPGGTPKHHRREK